MSTFLPFPIMAFLATCRKSDAFRLIKSAQMQGSPAFAEAATRRQGHFSAAGETLPFTWNHISGEVHVFFH